MTVWKTRRVVMLGAGYDDHALRFRSPSVKMFALEHPNTALDKQPRLAEDRLPAPASVHPPSAAVPPDAGAPCCRKCDSNVPTVSAGAGSLLVTARPAEDCGGSAAAGRQGRLTWLP